MIWGSGNSCSNGWCTIPANIQAGIQQPQEIPEKLYNEIMTAVDASSFSRTDVQNIVWTAWQTTEASGAAQRLVNLTYYLPQPPSPQGSSMAQACQGSHELSWTNFVCGVTALFNTYPGEFNGGRPTTDASNTFYQTGEYGLAQMVVGMNKQYIDDIERLDKGDDLFELLEYAPEALEAGLALAELTSYVTSPGTPQC